MSKTVNVGASRSQVELMAAIGKLIMRHTSHSPMTEEEVVTVLAFSLGCAIGQGPTRKDRRSLRGAAIANMDYGLEQVRGQGTGLLLPSGMALQ